MLALVASSQSFVPAAPVAPAQQMKIQMSAGPMYDEPYAPAGMGREFINSPRAPLESYVGASTEFGLGGKPWDPLQLTDLWKVSANNPDVAWLREAELKHGRQAMLAFVGIVLPSLGIHWAGDQFANDDWFTGLASVQEKSPEAIGQIVAFIAIMEGYTCSGIMDLWHGNTEKRTPGDLGFDPLKLMPKDEAAAKEMQLKELKNGRLAMIAFAAFVSAKFIPGSVPGL